MYAVLFPAEHDGAADQPNLPILCQSRPRNIQLSRIPHSRAGHKLPAFEILLEVFKVRQFKAQRFINEDGQTRLKKNAGYLPMALEIVTGDDHRLNVAEEVPIVTDSIRNLAGGT